MSTIHLKEYEKKYLKHLILLSIVDVIVIKLCLLFKIRIPIKKSLFDNLALLWIIDMFLWFALLNAFSSKKCRYTLSILVLFDYNSKFNTVYNFSYKKLKKVNEMLENCE